MSALSAESLRVDYGDKPVIEDLSLQIASQSFTAIIGPNGCGKSTLLKTFARVIRPSAGQVLLEGERVNSMRSRAVARRMSLLPQSPIAPDGITVRDLVARGRHPHHTLLRQWSHEDERAIDDALDRTGLTELASRRVAALSGGQRQRAWVAMVLAQDTQIILLDEPTTFLDIAHQYELLELCMQLNREGRTIVVVLHDLNQAARFASELVVLREGRIWQTGSPAEVMRERMLREVFGLSAEVVPDPLTGTPMVVPRPAGSTPQRTAARDHAPGQCEQAQ
ncbi:ABC transporter ATP-binding protein [Cumulibacter soli]|uniref:ABC transporter ATP-binding protein n=1 Tax=Cumulibacter soli TaxID=2546344 RepID=UPI001068B71A|nr:ABC transporter ATP-binding protein [Cumulibacter soli]